MGSSLVRDDGLPVRLDPCLAEMQGGQGRGGRFPRIPLAPGPLQEGVADVGMLQPLALDEAADAGRLAARPHVGAPKAKAVGRIAFALPLDLQGTAFQRDVWQQLLRIETGATTSYGEIARALGIPSASRAVGSAVGRNPVSIIVPCHRVVGSSGSLTGYAGGLDRKTSLLRIEAERARRRRGVPELELH